MMYLIGLDCIASLESFTVLCEDEREMQEIIRLVSQTEELKIMNMTAMPLTVRAREYIQQLKNFNKPDDLFFGNKEE